MAKVGQVWNFPTGEGLRIEEMVEGGLFTAQVRSMSTGEWTDYYVRGETAKLPEFLAVQNAVLEQAQ